VGPEITHLLDSLGWAILHSLWQGGVAFLVIVVWRLVLRGHSPALRHAGQYAALIGCLIAFFWTFSTYLGLSQTGIEGGATLSNQVADETPRLLTGLIAPFDPSALAAQTGLDISRLTSILACLWVLGFIVMSLRYTFAYGKAQQLRTLGIKSPSQIWTHRFTTLAKNAGVTKHIQFLISSNVDGPMTLGFFKPVVLVPVGFLTSLPVNQVEAVLLHELAHIRRYDYALNLIQTAVKTVLFFHPAIHIISRWADQDREQACDDLAVQQGRDPLALVRGLAALRLQNQPSLSLAATGDGQDTPLMARLARLAGQRPNRGRPEHLLMSIFSALLIGSIYLSSTSRANAHPVPPGSPELPATIVTAPPAPPVPPAPLTFPPLDSSKLKTQQDMRKFIEKDKSLYKQFAKNVEIYAHDLDIYLAKSRLNKEAHDHLTDEYVDLIDAMSDQFKNRRETIEDIHKAYVEAQQEKMEAHTEYITGQVKADAEHAQQVLQAQHRAKQAQHKAKKAQHDANTAQQKKRHKKAKQYADKTRTNTARLSANFREEVMAELLKDGLIKSPNETVLLYQPNDVTKLNNTALPKALRSKYCRIFDKYGLKNKRSKITIKPDSMDILTDWENGRHTTRMTFGSFHH